MDTTAMETTHSLIYEALRDVYEPELGVNVVDLGGPSELLMIERHISYPQS